MSVTLDKLASKAGRNLFLPIGFRFLLKLEQVEWDEFCEDPALATFTLRASQRLFKADGVVNWFDDWLEAEGAGVEVERGALGVVASAPATPDEIPGREAFARAAAVERSVEIAQRLCKETGEDATVLGYLTGARTLLTRLFGAAAARRLVKGLATAKLKGADKEAVEAAMALSLVLAKAYCEAGCGALVLAEDEPPGDLGYLSALAPLLNLVEYYGVPVLLLCRHPLNEAARAAARAARIQFISSPEYSNGVQMVPNRILLDNPEDAVSWARALPGGGDSQLFVSEWEIPAEAAPEAVIALRNEVVP